MMTQAFVAKAPPLVADEDGVIRVVGTRVQLETVVVAFDAGATAEEIAQQYASLDLADVYAVISYVLGNEAVVRDYMERRVQSARALRVEVERSMPPDGIRERLLARRRQANGA
jgi:uncharacterized protein (DUF433 family)